MSFVADGNLNAVLLFNLGVLVACLVYGWLADPAQRHHRIIYGGMVAFLLTAYLFWRSTDTLPVPELSLRGIWPYAFYFFETIAIVSAGGYVITFLQMIDRSAEADAAESEMLRTGRFPTVDVFICTYDEPLSVLEKSIVSAQFMNYPCHTVYVCDDTRRPEIKDYCDRIGVSYITRSDNRHAKAGNLNNALRHTNEMDAPSELIMVLDADFAVEERFLQRVVGMFRRSDIGIVQTPQFFYNADPLQHNLGIRKTFTDDQRVFFDVAQPAKDADGCAFCVGTSFVVRRSAINVIGGFPDEVITEDLWLTYRLLEIGYITRWLNERLSVGLSAEGVAEYTTQRTRWCHGTFQIALLKEGPLFGCRFTLKQRLHFINGILHWLSKPYLICVLLAPSIYWLFDASVIATEELLFLKYSVSVAVVCWAYSSWISGGRTVPVFTEISQLIAALPVSLTLAGVLLRPLGKPFEVTQKGGDRSRVRVHWPLARFFAFVAALTGLAMLMAAISWDAPTAYSDLEILHFIWAAIALFLAAICLIVCIERPRDGQDELVEISLDSWMHSNYVTRPVRISGLSADHIKLAGMEECDAAASAVFLPCAGWVRLENFATHAPGVFAMRPAFRQRIGIVRFLFRTAPDTIAKTGNMLGTLRGVFRRAFVSP